MDSLVIHMNYFINYYFTKLIYLIKSGEVIYSLSLLPSWNRFRCLFGSSLNGIRNSIRSRVTHFDSTIHKYVWTRVNSTNQRQGTQRFRKFSWAANLLKMENINEKKFSGLGRCRLKSFSVVAMGLELDKKMAVLPWNVFHYENVTNLESRHRREPKKYISMRLKFQ